MRTCHFPQMPSRFKSQLILTKIEPHVLVTQEDIVGTFLCSNGRWVPLMWLCQQILAPSRLIEVLLHKANLHSRWIHSWGDTLDFFNVTLNTCGRQPSHCKYTCICYISLPDTCSPPSCSLIYLIYYSYHLLSLPLSLSCCVLLLSSLI